MKRFSSLFFLATLLLPVLRAAYSPPVGGMTYTVPSGQSLSFTFPLWHGLAGAGKLMGRIEAVGSNYIDDSTAGWTAGAFSSTSIPYYVRIKTGAQAGRILLVNTSVANTATRITLVNDGADLTQSGIATGANGDVYEVVLSDTLSGLFGSTTLQGGTDASSADNVFVWNGSIWLTFYYNTTRSRWERDIDTAGSPTRDTFVLRPDRAVMITRLAGSTLTFRVAGRVPSVTPRHFHSRPGNTFISDGLPVSITLASLSLQTRAVGWVSGTSPSTADNDADLIYVWNGSLWLVFYYDSVNGRWQRNDGTNRDTFPIPAGRPIMIRRLNAGASTLDAFIPLPLPYTISQ